MNSAASKIEKLYTADLNAGVGGTVAEYRRTAALKSRTTGKHSAGYKKGGIVDFTGPALVHGSTSAPESFFDARATAALIEFTRVIKQQMSPKNYWCVSTY